MIDELNFIDRDASYAGLDYIETDRSSNSVMLYKLEYRGLFFNRNVERDLRNTLSGMRCRIDAKRDVGWLYICLTNTTVSDDNSFRRLAEQVLDIHSLPVYRYSKGYYWERIEEDTEYLTTIIQDQEDTLYL